MTWVSRRPAVSRKPNALNTHPNIERLFPSYREVERDFYRRTGIFPIMHVTAIRPEIVEQHRRQIVPPRTWDEYFEDLTGSLMELAHRPRRPR